MGLQASVRGYVMTSSSENETIEAMRLSNGDDSGTVPKLAPRLLIKNGERINTIVSDNLDYFDSSRGSDRDK